MHPVVRVKELTAAPLSGGKILRRSITRLNERAQHFNLALYYKYL